MRENYVKKQATRLLHNLDLDRIKHKLTVDTREEGVFRVSFTSDQVGYYDFTIDTLHSASYDDLIRVYDEHQGKGISRRLVMWREELCKDLKLRFVIITNNDNNRFWKHMGYKHMNYLTRRKLRKMIPPLSELKMHKSRFKAFHISEGSVYEAAYAT